MTDRPGTEEIFTQINLTNAWGEEESVSGPGSSESRTRLLRPRLTALVRDLEIRSLLDLPCGDFNWMRFTELPSVDYIGADIVPQLVHETPRSMRVRAASSFNSTCFATRCRKST